MSITHMDDLASARWSRQFEERGERVLSGMSMVEWRRTARPQQQQWQRQGCQDFGTSVNCSGRGRSRVPHDKSSTMAVIKSDNDAIISVILNLPVSRFIWQWVDFFSMSSINWDAGWALSDHAFVGVGRTDMIDPSWIIFCRYIKGWWEGDDGGGRKKKENVWDLPRWEFNMTTWCRSSNELIINLSPSYAAYDNDLSVSLNASRNLLSIFHCSPLFYFTHLICLYRNRTSRPRHEGTDVGWRLDSRTVCG